MNIGIVTPAPPRSRKGNRITAVRWSNILKSLHHRVHILQRYEDQPYHLLIALHAQRSYTSISRFSKIHPDRPLIVALTGTDLYRSIHTNVQAQQSLQLADRLIVLQNAGIQELAIPLRRKVCVINQSVKPPRGPFPKRKDKFEICVVGHLRSVKDPFRTARAVRLLPSTSRISVLHMGKALSESMARRAQAETEINPRYRWVGDWPHVKTLRHMGRCRLMVLSSKMEGGANVICEALALKVPVLSSHIAGSVGLLGTDYPGYFPVGDTKALTELLHRAENQHNFYRTLQSKCQAIALLVKPVEERKRWATLLQSFSV